MTMSGVIFYLLAAYVLVCGIGVVRQTNLFHAGISLIGCFLGVAGLYITLASPFMAAMQVLIYAGAISVVLLFGFMLTHDLMKPAPPAFQKIPAMVSAALLAALLCLAAFHSNWVPADQGGRSLRDVEQLGFSYMTANFLPFQIVAILLLAALIGAVVIARKEESPRES